jgi:chorismate--pyruvate lyase
MRENDNKQLNTNLFHDIKLPNTFKIWHKKDFLALHTHPEIYSWLLDTNSLTQRIINYCQTHLIEDKNFSVQVLSETEGMPSQAEAARLKLPINQKAYLREVILYCGKKAVIYAKTIIPLNTLTGKQRELASLGNKPLGAYLFSQPNLLRDDIEVSQITHLYQQKQQQLWARRSAFYLEKKPLLVYEVFLPNLIEKLLSTPIKTEQ